MRSRYNQSSIVFSAAVLLALLVLQSCGPDVHGQARIPRNPAPSVTVPATPRATPAPGSSSGEYWCRTGRNPGRCRPGTAPAVDRRGRAQ